MYPHEALATERRDPMKQMHRIVKARAYIEEETLRRMLRWMVPSAIQALGTEDGVVLTTVATEHETNVSGHGELSMCKKFRVHDQLEFQLF